MNYIIYLAYITVAFLSIFLFAFIIYNRKKLHSVGLSLFCISLFIYSFASSFEITAASDELALFFIKIERIGFLSLPIFWLITSLEYTNKKHFLTKKFYLIMFSIFLIFNIFSLTDSYHHLIYKEYYFTHPYGLNILTLKGGIVYYLIFAFANICILIGNVLYIHFHIKNKKYQKRSLLMMIASLVPWLGLWLYTFHFFDNNLDVNPFFLGIAALLFTIALFTNNIFDINVIARNHIVDHLNTPIITLDEANQIIDVNGAVNSFFNDKKSKLLNIHIKYLLPNIYDKMLTNKNNTNFIEHLVWKKEKENLSLKIEVIYLPGETKIIIINDETLTQKMLNDLHYYATTESLTQIYNRNEFIKQVNTLVKKNSLNKTPMLFAILDIDNFKIYNDQYGHLVGDYIIKKVASCLKSVFTNRALYARFGGDEFVIALEEKEKEAAVILIERFYRKINNLINIVEGKTVQVTCSIGVCWVEDLVEGDFEQYIKGADNMLYKSKMAGKNRISYCNYPSCD